MGQVSTFLTSNGVIHKLRQKKLDDQLNTICQKDMYSVALELAKQHSLPDVKVQEIKKSYGDYLFKKGSKGKQLNSIWDALKFVIQQK